jgi:Domain of unknown function (DUF1905)/Bacteriocin-protection, YdeI or OmpD-Associated
MPKSYKFTARIEAGDRGGAFLFFPYDVEEEFGTKGRVPVKATIDGVAYTGSLIKYGAPQHMLGVEKAIRQQIGKVPGDHVEVLLKKDDEIREVDVPPAFKTLMKKAGVLTFFEGLSYTHRKEYCRWITEAKKDETRVRRLAKAVEMLRDKVKTPG